MSRTLPARVQHRVLCASPSSRARVSSIYSGSCQDARTLARLSARVKHNRPSPLPGRLSCYAPLCTSVASKLLGSVAADKPQATRTKQCTFGWRSH